MVVSSTEFQRTYLSKLRSIVASSHNLFHSLYYPAFSGAAGELGGSKEVSRSAKYRGWLAGICSQEEWSASVQTQNKCLRKINYKLIAKAYQHFFDMPLEACPAFISLDIYPLVFHKPPEDFD